MLFGQSVFQSVLERLKEEDDDDAEGAEASSSHRVSGLNTGLAFDVMEGVSASSQRVDQAYFDNLGMETLAKPVEKAAPPPAPEPEPEPEPEPVMPEHLSRTSPLEVATELALSGQDTLHTLSEKRRSFAKANHPDGVAPLFRENANKRMKLANLLIDEAVRRLSR